MIFNFHPLASAELDEAVKYYEEIREGLGLEFLEELYSTIERIINFPSAWVQVSQSEHSLTPLFLQYQLSSDLENSPNVQLRHGKS